MHKKYNVPKNAPKYSLGDIVDKLSILVRKIYFGEEAAFPEYTYLVDGLNTIGISGEFLSAVIRLTQMNFEIWNLENDLRKGGEGKFSLQEIGKRAIKIRNLNRKRVQYKNEINKITSLGFKEIKVNHLSQ